MADLKPNYAEKINNLLSVMPDFVQDFIYNFGDIDKLATKLEYCRDIKVFLSYSTKHIDAVKGKSIKKLTFEDLNQITSLDINRYLVYLADDGKVKRKASTIKRKKATIACMYNYFLSAGLVIRNPVSTARRVKAPEKPIIYLTDEEQILLLETVKSGNGLAKRSYKQHYLYQARDTAMFLLLLDTGLRISELCNTNIEDYNLEDCSVVVLRKGGDSEIVYYSDETADSLKEYFDHQLSSFDEKPSDLAAFTTTKGNRLGVRECEYLVKKYAKACLPDKYAKISPHKIRSSFAMSFYSASNNNILLLQKKMHHKSITTTNIYAKAAEQDIKESRMLLANRRKQIKST